MKMFKSDIVTMVSKHTKVPKNVVGEIIDATIDSIVIALSQGDEVQFSEFGTFELKQRAARMGRNPHTNEPVPIPARKIPSFRASHSLKNVTTKTE